MTDQVTISQPMQLPLRSANQFREQYKNKHVTLRGPVDPNVVFEWMKYAKSVSVVTSKVE